MKLLIVFLIWLSSIAFSFAWLLPPKIKTPWILRLSENMPPDTSKRSRFNEKVAAAAKKLRDEAATMEAEMKAEMNVTIPIADNMVPFVSKFPEALKLSADQQKAAPCIGANSTMKNETTTSSSSSSSSSSSVYTSVLTSRDEDRSRKVLVDKISGEIKKQIGVDAVSDETTEDKRSFYFAEDEDDALGKAIIEEEDEDDDVLTPFLDAVITTTNLTTLIFPYTSSTADMSSLFRDNENDPNAPITLPTLDRFYSMIQPWAVRQLYRYLASTMVGEKTKNQSKEDAEDAKILEMAYTLTILQVIADVDKLSNSDGSRDSAAMGLDDIMEIANDFTILQQDAFFRADYLRYRSTGKVPSVLELQKYATEVATLAAKADADPRMLPQLAVWRVATMQRILGTSERAKKERKALWGSDSVALSAESSVISNRDSNNVLVEGQKALGEVVEALERKNGGDTSSSTGVGSGNESNLPPALLALARTLNSTFGKIAETNNMLADVAAEESNTRGGARLTTSMETTLSEKQQQQFDNSTTARMAKLESMDITTMTPEELREYFKPDSESLSKMLSMLSEKVAQEIEEEGWSTAAERFVADYFDKMSRMEGAVISREGAGRFQAEILRGIFVTAKVNMFRGAYIFEGRYTNTSSVAFAANLEERLQASPMVDEIGYTILMNEKYPNLENGMEQAAIENLLGSSPAVVVYPKSWNSVVASVTKDPNRRFWRNAIAAAGVLTSGAFAAGSFDIFNTNGPLVTTGLFPDEFLNMALVPLFIHYSSSLAELVVGAMKGFEVTSILIPSFTLPTFGSRSTYTTMPKNRNDLFDVAIVGAILPLVMSFLTFAYGLQLTSQAASEAIAQFPVVSLSLLKTNTILSQMLTQSFPDIFQPLTDAIAAQKAIDALAQSTEGVGAAATTAAAVTAAIPMVHLHWLAIVGGLSLTAYVLQLIPIDNSSGSKLSFSVLGQDFFTILTSFLGGLKFLFVLPMLFSFNPGPVTPKRLLFDYFVLSQLAGNPLENQFAKDNITPVSEGRLIIYAGMMSLLFFSLLDVTGTLFGLSENIDAAIVYIKSLTAGSTPLF